MRAEMQVEHQTNVLDFCDDETSEYAILSHRWINDTEISYEEMVLANMGKEEWIQFVGRLGTRRSWILVSRCRKTDMSGSRRTSAALTSEAVQSCWRPSIRCIAGTQMPRHAICTLMTLTAPDFPLRKRL